MEGRSTVLRQPAERFLPGASCVEGDFSDDPHTGTFRQRMRLEPGAMARWRGGEPTE
ncbi:hypothetical protein GCM10010448_51960 [Streptomyces glomeratus]|uniref:Uncharacterized protein n=1 Tax=Streptomyces glomeratus TaxID=284452 RepID=A0ABP6LUV2_9ACTN